MALSRGSVVFVRDKSAFLTKGRPAVVIQANVFIGARQSLTVVPFTSAEGEPLAFRPRIRNTAANGLSHPSDAMVDKVVSVRAETVSKPAGKLSAADLRAVDAALRLWLDL